MVGDLRSTGLLLLGVLLAGCQSPLAAFYCTDAESCGTEGAVCEPDRLCSLPDDTCPSGRRYSNQSGSRSGLCTSPSLADASPGRDTGRPDSRVIGTADSSTTSLTCDSGFSYAPDPALANNDIQIDFHDSTMGWTFVGIEVVGPGTADASETDFLEGTEWTWRWSIRFNTPGVYSLTVTQGETPQDLAHCDIEIK